MYCKNCGNSIDDKAVICPKCGVATHGNESNQQSAANVQGKTNVMAIIGLVFAFLFPIVGLICSIIGRKQCRTTGENGMGLATAGMIISIVFLAFGVIGFIIYIIALAAVLA